MDSGADFPDLIRDFGFSGAIYSCGNVSVNFSTAELNVSHSGDSKKIEIGIKISLTPEQACIVAKLIQLSTSNMREPITITTMADLLGYQTEKSFKQGYLNLMEKLRAFPIANEGGTGSVFFEDTITARDLFEENGEELRFKTALAELVGTACYLTEEQLYSIEYVPSDYKPPVYCL